MDLSFNISVRKIFGDMSESDEKEMAELLKTSLGGGLTEKAISLLLDLTMAVATNAPDCIFKQIALQINQLNENKELIN